MLLNTANQNDLRAMSREAYAARCLAPHGHLKGFTCPRGPQPLLLVATILSLSLALFLVDIPRFIVASDPYYFTGIDIQVVDGREFRFAGDTAVLRALPLPSGSVFPGTITWTAVSGYFLESGTATATGETVTWQSPSSHGGYATITATCGGKDDSVGLAYVRIDISPNGGDLVREGRDQFAPSVEPPEAPVSFLSGEDTSFDLKLTLQAPFIIVDNLIEELDVRGHLNSATAWIEGKLPSGEASLFGREYSMKKMFAPIYNQIEKINGDTAFKVALGKGADKVKEYYQDYFEQQGMDSLPAGLMADKYKSSLLNIEPALNPFATATLDNDTIPESTTFSWNIAVSLENTLGTWKIGVNPVFDPPSISGIIDAINEHGLEFNTAYWLPNVSYGMHVVWNNTNWFAGAELSGQAGRNVEGHFEVDATAKLSVFLMYQF